MTRIDLGARDVRTTSAICSAQSRASLKEPRKGEGDWMPGRRLPLTSTWGTGEEVGKEGRHPFVVDLESLAKEVDALPGAVGRHCTFTVRERGMTGFCYWFQASSSPDNDRAMELQGHVDSLIKAAIQCSDAQLGVRLSVTSEKTSLLWAPAPQTSVPGRL